ncbi:hypothetical protein C8J57DRAFT_1242128 [Mycena rebaudengoi]|nr:hypothetical protein C8J57DRAFT_1242128 [Mycena rebaudengoi]
MTHSDSDLANKSLLNNKVKTDPPGQFKALLIGGSAGAKQGTPSGEESTDTKKEEIEGGKPSGGELDEAQGKDSTTNKDKPVDGDEFESEFSDDCTSSASVNSNKDLDTRLDDFEIEDISHKKTEITFVSTETPDTMLVKFFSAQNPAAEPREVYLPTSSISVAATASADGIVKFSARISEIVPVAVKFDSPIKAHGGAIFRPPIRAGGSQLRLGKIQDICAGKSNALQVSLVDKYELNTASDGLLSCDFFLDRELTTAEGSPDASKDNSTTTGDTFTAPAASDSAATPAAVDDSAVPAPVGASVNPAPKARLQFTGEGTDIPLAIATDRARNNPRHKLADPGVHEKFIEFLRDHAEAAVDIPTSFPHAKTIKDVRYMVQVAVVDVFKPWQPTSGGYVVPTSDDYDCYHNQSFTKDHIYQVLRLKPSNAATDVQIFSRAHLAPARKAREWVKSGGNSHSDTFSEMTPAEFKKYVEKEKVRAKKKARSSVDKEEGTSRKRRHESSDSGEETAGAKKKKKSKGSKGKGKGKVVADSSDLDD